jgi:hypothetical protein
MPIVIGNRKFLLLQMPVCPMSRESVTTGAFIRSNRPTRRHYFRLARDRARDEDTAPSF